MPLNSGALDRRITLQQSTVTYDSFNNPVETWEDIATIWASKEELSDSEQIRAKEVGAEITSRWKIRYSARVADINPKWRFANGGRTYQVVGVKEIDRRVGFELSAVVRSDG